MITINASVGCFEISHEPKDHVAPTQPPPDGPLLKESEGSVGQL